MEKALKSFNRVAVNFGGFDKIQQMAAVRLAASADIPYPRFFGQSPGGLNSTGEGSLAKLLHDDRRQAAREARPEHRHGLTRCLPAMQA